MNSEFILEALNASGKNTLGETLEMEFIEVSDDKLVAKMPVTSKVHQPDGVLHGGASVALAETVGSVASVLRIDREQQTIRGLEISANHVRSIREGFVFATATPIHIGRTTHIWEIKIKDQQERLISHCKLTTIVIDKK